MCRRDVGLRQCSAKNDALEFDYIPYPTNTGEQIEPSFIATAYLAVGDHSSNKEEALRFLSYYTSEQGQRDRLKMREMLFLL